VIDYRLHLASQSWQALRERVLARAGGRCEWPGCPQARGLQLHHRHYRTLGHEALADVALLCDAHHRLRTVLDWKCRACGRPAFTRAAAARWLRYNPGCVAAALNARAPRFCGACSLDWKQPRDGPAPTPGPPGPWVLRTWS
jgi:hypothetical protein